MLRTPPFLFTEPHVTASPVFWFFTRSVSAWDTSPAASAGLSDSEEPSRRSVKSITLSVFTL